MPETKRAQLLPLYWKCQIIGWGIVSLLWLYIALVRDRFSIMDALTNYVLDIAICIGLTHSYRTISLKKGWGRLGIKELIKRVIPSILILSVMFMLLMNIKMAAYIYMLNGNNTFSENLLLWNPVLITGVRHMSIWVLAYHAYKFYVREINTAKKNAQLSVIAKQTQLDKLSMQLNPHFLFNSLNSIKALTLESPKTARRAIDLLSDLLRSSLYEKEHATITIAEELSLVKDYVELEQLRFEERLRVIMNVDETIKGFAVPPLCIQLLVENAIKHGIDQQLDGGTVKISVQTDTCFIIINVKNPGGLSKKEHKGLGLKNLRERLLLQYEGKAQLEIGAPTEHLISTTLKIPIDKT
ncbi:sensor histidine kinase [Galbibacter pacificus]|uniref:Histidine kinase n=1 Tax=Galbibacter pacificus TaxID=2996052 RepID=A0ABT6FRR2_9FLAO|nr:histidine kinase [Galbibacter pacificus]MDG3582928.1 histidine kinase [Galbibacter pacificus]MDG3585953.1 histidine kinase [Galbibacter pacificus]